MNWKHLLWIVPACVLIGMGVSSYISYKDTLELAEIARSCIQQLRECYVN
jgi:hypothetical protein